MRMEWQRERNLEGKQNGGVGQNVKAAKEGESTDVERMENVMQVCAGGRETGCESRYFDRYWRAVNVPGEWKGQARPDLTELLRGECERHANREQQAARRVATHC